MVARARRRSGWSGRVVGGDEWSEKAVVDCRVEERDALAVGSQVVGVGALAALDEAVEAESGEVVDHLVGAVSGAEQMGRLGTEASVGESEGVQSDRQ